MAASKTTLVRKARATYTAVKKLYHQAGKKARGKAKTSPAYREYKEVKAAYKTAGQRLGRLTGRKNRK